MNTRGTFPELYDNTNRRLTVPKFLEDKLKQEYGADSATPYKVMNKLGYMRGNKETAKGRAAEAKHAMHVGRKGRMSGNHKQHRGGK